MVGYTVIGTHKVKSVALINMFIKSQTVNLRLKPHFIQQSLFQREKSRLFELIISRNDKKKIQRVNYFTDGNFIMGCHSFVLSLGCSGDSAPSSSLASSDSG